MNTKKLRVYDNDGDTLDRYTVIIDTPTLKEMLSLSDNPDSPLGVSQFSSGTEGAHLGRKIPFSSLPVNVQKHIKMRLS